MTEIDLKQLEECIKLVQKYQLEELTLADGTRIVKKSHPLKPTRQKKAPIQPINTAWTKDEVMFASTMASPMTLDKFSPLMNPPKDDE